MLTSMTIRNFKVLGDADIELGRSVVFVGPNNSGKTTALRCLAEIAHLDILDVDGLGHALLREPRIRGAVVELCGRSVLDDDGGLDRVLLGKMVFEDKELRNRFDAIVHVLAKKLAMMESAITGR